MMDQSPLWVLRVAEVLSYFAGMPPREVLLELGAVLGPPLGLSSGLAIGLLLRRPIKGALVGLLLGATAVVGWLVIKLPPMLLQYYPPSSALASLIYGLIIGGLGLLYISMIALMVLQRR